MQFEPKYKDGKWLVNEYECVDCSKHCIEHKVIYIPDGFTDKRSDWGEGIPTTRRKCTNCDKTDGPWVSSELVGGGY